MFQFCNQWSHDSLLSAVLCICFSLLTADPSKKIGFGVKLALVCSEPWVDCPSHLDLMNIARIFTVQIDPTGLPAGVHASR